MCNRSKMVPANILKTAAVQLQQIKHKNMIHIIMQQQQHPLQLLAIAHSITSYHCKTFFSPKNGFHIGNRTEIGRHSLPKIRSKSF